ncbi:glycosyltransferase [Synechocystis sp. PCC 7509]|uniref:glycosyltransferase n=1 Tax=Synechocystis sp. PCC 7509 TaxID=927677 RepID=UPI0002ABD7BF|nr:glycosyltransferase [Synechocystis sp. PCC 7509]
MNSTDICKDETQTNSPTNSGLRVLFVSHTYVVGVNQGKLNAIAATNQATVGLLVPQKWQAKAWGKRFEVETPYPNIQLYPAKVWFEGKVGAYFYPPWVMGQAIADFCPDIIQVEQEVFSLAAFEFALWARFTGKPLVLFCWENRDRQLSIVRTQLRQFVLNTAQLIIAGNLDGEELLRRWGYTGLIEVMPQMGVDTTLFHPGLRPPPSDRPLIVGFVGRLAHQKGIDVLIAAVSQLRDRALECQVVLCGSGAEEEMLRQEAQKQNVADLITWRGGVRHDEVPAEMSKFDVLVLPSRSVPEWKEQFGHVLIEAMAMGIPVIGSSCGEIPNVIGRPDLVFSEGDAGQLAAILERMIGDRPWRQQLEQDSLTRAKENYTHERIAERSLELWRKAIKQKDSEGQQ